MGLEIQSASLTYRKTSKYRRCVLLWEFWEFCSTEQSPSWEVHRSSASQDIPSILPNPVYCFHKSLSLS